MPPRAIDLLFLRSAGRLSEAVGTAYTDGMRAGLLVSVAIVLAAAARVLVGGKSREARRRAAPAPVEPGAVADPRAGLGHR